jgi:hypothetical protein
MTEYLKLAELHEVSTFSDAALALVKDRENKRYLFLMKEKLSR